MFITIDGPDGTGKTTVAHSLVKKLQEKSFPAIYTSEPTDSPLGVRIRQALKDGGADLPLLTDLFIQDRRNHVEGFILPQMQQGKTIICDRYKYSTICYQHLQGEPIEKLIAMNAPFPSPSLAIILYSEHVDTLLNRISKRGLDKDLFETRGILEKSIRLYKEMPHYYPDETFAYIEVDMDLDTILEKVVGLVVKQALDPFPSPKS